MTEQPRNRQDIPATDKWNVAALYPNDAAWEADLTIAQDLPEVVEVYRGRLGESARMLGEALTAWFESMRHLEKVYVYAHLRSDEDLGNDTYKGMLDRARTAMVRLSTAGAYLSPEILTIDDARINYWLHDPQVAPYAFWIKDILRGKPHTLTPSEERIMAMVSEPLSTISDIYKVLKNVDLSARIKPAVDSEGQEHPLTHGTFVKLEESRDRTLRKSAFDAYYGEFAGNRNTNAAALNGQIKAHLFEAQARNYGSALEAALFDDAVPTAVYNALIEAVHEALPSFYRYVALRKRLLGVDKLHIYDTYVPVIPAVDLKYSYDESVQVISDGLRVLGDEYVSVMRDGLMNGWVDRYENVGKRSGAYSSGCYDSMPYILLNHNGTVDACFTLAHELGHSMHSWYANRNQPYHLADYRILVAEVASTTNEKLLHHHLLSQTNDKAVRAYLINQQLDDFRGTLFRQTMFAEFEKLIHERAEAGEPLTVNALDETYYGLVKLYFGDTVAFDDEDRAIAWEWSRVDHFFYDFYVYKYATGMSAAVALSSALLNEGQPALERYLAFLKGGGSQYPLDLLKTAGVDLTTPTPVQAALAEFTRLVAELEALVG